MKIAPHLVVHERDPLKRAILVALVALALIGFGYLIYDYGHSRSDYDFDSLVEQNKLLQDKISQITDELEKTKDDLVASKSGNEINKLAYKEVDASLRNLQSEILELKEEVAFYRSIVAPRESERGLRIQRFNIKQSSNGYRYKLVLTQVIKNTRVTNGNIIMEVEGVRKGKAVKLNLTELSAKKQAQLNFRFKYFQSFEGDLVMPKDFKPSRVHITVSSSRVKLNKTFAWPKQTRTGSLKTSAL